MICSHALHEEVIPIIAICSTPPKAVPSWGVGSLLLPWSSFHAEHCIEADKLKIYGASFGNLWSFGAVSGYS